MTRRVNVGTLIAPSPRPPQGSGQGEGRVAIVDLSRPDTPREITYEALDARCRAVAAGLTARGLTRGDRVGILALNRTEYIEALYGTMRAGAIPVPLNIKLPAEALAFIARDAGLKLLFIDPAHGKISHAAPMAIALFGKKVGDTVTVNGKQWEIVSIDAGK